MKHLLMQGPSYLEDKEHRYRVFSFNFDDYRPSRWILRPARNETFSRLYPNILGMLGDPGDGLVIAQQLPGDLVVEVIYGYIGWDAFPVLLWFATMPCNPEVWKDIGLAAKNIAWLKERIDRRTKLVRARMLEEGKRRQAVAEAQESAREKARRVLHRVRYRDRQAEYRRKAKERKRLKEEQAKERKRLEEASREWRTAVLDNLRGVHAILLARALAKELDEKLALEEFL